jgi:RNA polymerase sigma factor for flagellar operon FliA
VAKDVERLVAEAMPIVDNVARSLARRLGGVVPLDDLLALGTQALYEAARDFDPSRGPFRAYAVLRIRWALVDAVRRETHGRSAHARALALVAAERVADAVTAPRDEEPATEQEYQERLRALLESRAAALAVGLVIGADTSPEQNPEEVLSRRQMARFLRRAVSELDERERALVERHYYGGEPFDAIARDLGISKSWASRLHAQAIARLGKVLRRGPVKTAPSLRGAAAASDE